MERNHISMFVEGKKPEGWEETEKKEQRKIYQYIKILENMDQVILNMTFEGFMWSGS